MIRLGLYANDQGANNVLDAVEQAAKASGRFEVVRIPGLNLDVGDDAIAKLASASALVFGISSGATAGAELRVATRALTANRNLWGKMLCVEDFPGSSGVKDVYSLGESLHLGSIMPLGPDAPERAAYKDVHVLGSPDHWVPSMQNIEHGATDRRNWIVMKRKRGSTQVGLLGPSDIVVYFSGFKTPDKEEATLKQLLSVKKVEGRDVVIHFRPHPGESNQRALVEAIRKRDALLDGQWELAVPAIVNGNKLADSWLLGVTDLTVAHPGATSNFWMAALRRPMICNMGYVSEADQAASSYDYNLTRRNVLAVESDEELPEVVSRLLTKKDALYTNLVAQQQRNAQAFDLTQPPTYGKNVLAIIEKLLS